MNWQEEDLVEALKSGDQEAFRHMVTTWQDMIFNTSLGLLQNDQDAEDITQEVFIKSYEAIHQFKGESKLSTWLYRIAVTKSLDHLRSKKRKKRFGYIFSLFGDKDEMIIDPPDFIHPGILEEKKSASIALFKALDKIPEQQKAAFVLSKMEGLPQKQVAEVLDVSVAAVESLLQRAKTNLKKQLTEFYQQFSE